MDKNGNLINSPDNGVAITDYKYDEVGNRTETLSFDKDKVAVNLTAQK
jgi:YD repeat-containing protein